MKERRGHMPPGKVRDFLEKKSEPKGMEQPGEAALKEDVGVSAEKGRETMNLNFDEILKILEKAQTIHELAASVHTLEAIRETCGYPWRDTAADIAEALLLFDREPTEEHLKEIPSACRLRAYAARIKGFKAPQHVLFSEHEGG